MKIGDRLTIDGQLVEVTYVMNEKAFGYKPVKEEKIEAPVDVEAPVEATVEAPKRRRRKA